MSLLTVFYQKLFEALAPRNLSVHHWSHGGRYSSNLLEIATSPKTTILYVKEFNVFGKLGFWGLTRNQIERLEKADSHWFVVFLLRSSASGYVLASAEVVKHIADGSFELSRDGDFKVNEGQDFQTVEAFGSIEELLNRTLPSI